MKLQNLIIIFIIIIIPIIVIFSYYLNLEVSTVEIQTRYDEILIEATQEAIEAFEINTTELNSEYNTLANSKRRDIMSSINTFVMGLSNKLGISGITKENVLQYVPAVVFIMYDGYYIYTPTYVPETLTDEKGVQLFYYKDAIEEKQILSEPTQMINGEKVQGEPIYKPSEGGISRKYYYNENEYKNIAFETEVSKAKKTYKHVLKTFVPYTTTYEKNGSKYIINYTLDNYIRVYGEGESNEGYILNDDYIPINPPIEVLEENIAFRNDVNEEITVDNYIYVYNSNGEKRYYDGKFFTVDKNYVKQYLPDAEVGVYGAEYKKLLWYDSQTPTKCKEIYQLLNTLPTQNHDNNWYINIKEKEIFIHSSEITIQTNQDSSAWNYYNEAICFNNWLNDKGFTKQDIQNILDNREDSIVNNINNNLKLSIANYSSNSNMTFKLPKISDEDWEQALSNISIITFFQGTQAGLKMYNNYAIVSSTENNEFVSEDSIYLLNNIEDYYHRYGCGRVEDVFYKKGYKNTDFIIQSYNYNNDTKYYYKHTKEDETPYSPCFNCIINRNKMVESRTQLNFYEEEYRNALARERYALISKIKLTK